MDVVRFGKAWLERALKRCMWGWFVGSQNMLPTSAGRGHCSAPANTQHPAKGAERGRAFCQITSWQILALISLGLTCCYRYGSGTAVQSLSSAMKKIISAFEVLISHREKGKKTQEELKVLSWEQGCIDGEHQRSQNPFPEQAEFTQFLICTLNWATMRTENQSSVFTQIVIIST